MCARARACVCVWEGGYLCVCVGGGGAVLKNYIKLHISTAMWGGKEGEGGWCVGGGVGRGGIYSEVFYYIA